LKKGFIFGVGDIGKRILKKEKENICFLGYVDNDPNKQGKSFDGLEVFPSNYLKKIEFDQLFIATITDPQGILEWLEMNGIERQKVVIDYAIQPIQSRIVFLESLAEFMYAKNLEGNVAEAGVFKGNFACEINKAFPDKKLYLFDTFEGFDDRDILMEKQYGYSKARPGRFSDTSEEIVLEKMPNRENCIVKKGYFPSTAQEITDEFCFVNLDLDLYQPTKEGLKWFAQHMKPGGVILVHDYIACVYSGVHKAVTEYLMDDPRHAIPIGDGMSIAILF